MPHLLLCLSFLVSTVDSATHKRRQLARDDLSLVFGLLDFQALGTAHLPITEELGFLNFCLGFCHGVDVASIGQLWGLASASLADLGQHPATNEHRACPPAFPAHTTPTLTLPPAGARAH